MSTTWQLIPILVPFENGEVGIFTRALTETKDGVQLVASGFESTSINGKILYRVYTKDSVSMRMCVNKARTVNKELNGQIRLRWDYLF